MSISFSRKIHPRGTPTFHRIRRLSCRCVDSTAADASAILPFLLRRFSGLVATFLRSQSLNNFHCLPPVSDATRNAFGPRNGALHPRRWSVVAGLSLFECLESPQQLLGKHGSHLREVRNDSVIGEAELGGKSEECDHVSGRSGRTHEFNRRLGMTACRLARFFVHYKEDCRLKAG